VKAGFIPVLVDRFKGGGFYANSAFYTAAGLYGAGVSYENDEWLFSVLGGVSFLDSTANGEQPSKYIVGYDMVENGKVGAIFNHDVGVSGKSGITAYYGYATNFSGFDVQVEALLDLSDDAETAATSIVPGPPTQGLARQLVSVYLGYDLDSMNRAYAGLDKDLNSARTIVQTVTLGLEHTVNPVITSIVNLEINNANTILSVGLNFSVM